MTGVRPAGPDQHQRWDVATGYGVMLGICLPRDELTVPVIRHLVGDALTQIGVLEEVRRDIQLAVSDACTNVLDHAGPGDAYEMTVTIRTDRCEIRVIDVGHGLDHASVGAHPTLDGDLTAERGRGLVLMRALVDQIELLSEPEEGTLVRLVKQLAFDDTAPARQLLLRAQHGYPRPPTAPDSYPSDGDRSPP